MLSRTSEPFSIKMGIVLCLPMLATFLLIIVLAEPVAGQPDETKIAYIASSTENNQIRMISPDGSNDQLVWQSPVSLPPFDMPWWLDWKPDGSEIMFDSGHDWTRSMAIRDLYGVAPDGSQLRRISAPPGPYNDADLPTGQVTFILDAFENGDVSLYIEGMSEPIEYFARTGESYIITATVADWGEDVRQFIRIYDPDPLSEYCHFSEEGWVDVIPGQLTDYGRLSFGVVADQTCPLLFSPTWSPDGRSLIYLREDPTITGFTENSVWQTDDPAPVSTIGTRLINMHQYVSRDHLYRIVAAPAGEREGEFLILENQLNPLIVHTNTTNPDPDLGYRPNTCPDQPIGNCEFLDIQWLPDGSGFIYSQVLEPAGSGPYISSFYRYTFASGQFEELFTLENAIFGKIAISPDGSQIAFEAGPNLEESTLFFLYGPRLICPCEIWVVNTDGTGLRQLVADGRAPAWSEVAPTVVNQPNPTPVPGQTPQPTPLPTPITNPNVVPQLWFAYVRR